MYKLLVPVLILYVAYAVGGVGKSYPVDELGICLSDLLTHFAWDEPVILAVDKKNGDFYVFDRRNTITAIQAYAGED